MEYSRLSSPVFLNIFGNWLTPTEEELVGMRDRLSASGEPYLNTDELSGHRYYRDKNNHRIYVNKNRFPKFTSSVVNEFSNVFLAKILKKDGDIQFEDIAKFNIDIKKSLLDTIEVLRKNPPVHDNVKVSPAQAVGMSAADIENFKIVISKMYHSMNLDTAEEYVDEFVEEVEMLLREKSIKYNEDAIEQT